MSSHFSQEGGLRDTVILSFLIFLILIYLIISARWILLDVDSNVYFSVYIAVIHYLFYLILVSVPLQVSMKMNIIKFTVSRMRLRRAIDSVVATFFVLVVLGLHTDLLPFLSIGGYSGESRLYEVIAKGITTALMFNIVIFGLLKKKDHT